MKKLAIFLLIVSIAVVPLGAQTERDTPPADSAPADTTQTDTVAPPLPWPLYVQARLDTLTSARLFRSTQLGLMVYDLTADSVLYRHGEQQQLRPASTMKLVTSITALDRLGGSYQFTTRLYCIGAVADSTLVGDLVCVGGMDPLFGDDDLQAFVESVAALGVDTIRGRIVADRSFKDGDLLGEGWCWDDDNPVLSPLLLKREDNLTDRFGKELARRGIALLGESRASTWPSGRRLLAIRTHTIDDVLPRMMKNSDNLYAEAMFYQLATASDQHPIKASHSAACIRQLLSQLGQPADTYRIADGSGLSLYNYVTAEMEVRLLRYAWQQRSIYEHLWPMLPIAGQDGTLKSRMLGTAAQGNVHAKTGTVTGVSSLAGYLTAPNGHELCFAIINQGIMQSQTGRAFQDRVCAALCTAAGVKVNLSEPPVAKPKAKTAVRRPAARQAAKSRKGSRQRPTKARKGRARR